MKISIQVDCSPEEARTFLGLPDVSAANAAFAEALTEKTAAAMKGLDPEALMKMWMPGGAAMMGELQKAFWDQMTGGTQGGKKGK